MASCGEDKWERKKMNTVEACLLDERFGFSRVTRHWRSLWVAQKVKDCSEVLWVTIDENAAKTIAANLVPTRKKVFKVASRLLNKGGPGRLEDGATY